MFFPWKRWEHQSSATEDADGALSHGKGLSYYGDRHMHTKNILNEMIKLMILSINQTKLRYYLLNLFTSTRYN